MSEFRITIHLRDESKVRCNGCEMVFDSPNQMDLFDERRPRALSILKDCDTPGITEIPFRDLSLVVIDNGYGRVSRFVF